MNDIFTQNTMSNVHIVEEERAINEPLIIFNLLQNGSDTKLAMKLNSLS